MATKSETAEFLADQVASAGAITTRKMFGEYALYCDGKVVALICDNQLFIKPTATSTNFLDDSHLAAPYPGAKLHYCVPEDRWDDSDWLSDFIRETTALLPEPKPKKAKK